jgi:hypothetical protein
VIELAFIIIGVMVAFFVIIGGMFWSWNFITSAFDGAFTRFEDETASPFTFSPPPNDGEMGWAGATYQVPVFGDDDPEKLREH